MRAKPECFLCVFSQALNTARLVSRDEGVHLEVLKAVAARMAEADLNQTPASLSQPVYQLVSEISGIEDPYRRKKAASNAEALALLDRIRDTVNSSSDPLRTAIKAAAAGNIIDLGIGHSFDLKRDINLIMNQPLALDATDKLRQELREGVRVLYLGDNAGEIVFDMLLVEQLLEAGAKVTFTVKSGPVINDATLVDATEVGMTDLVEVIETGSDDIGVNWQAVSDEFLTYYNEADIIISKGHGNFETTDDRGSNSYFLLKAKCQMVARQLGVQLGDVVFHRLGDST
jgi:uncharacterized protein with ATP-grasp and redox domains